MSFGWKLIGALTITALCAVMGTYLLTTRALSTRFDEFRAQDLQLAAQDLAGLLGEYCRRKVHGRGWRSSLLPRFSCGAGGRWSTRRACLGGLPWWIRT